MKFYSSRPGVDFLKIKKKKKIRKFSLALICTLMFTITYYPYQYGRMLAYGIVSSSFFPDWRGQLPLVIIYGTGSVVLLLISITLIKYIASSKPFRVCSLCIFFLILESVFKIIIVYLSIFILTIGIFIFLYNKLYSKKRVLKNKKVIYLFEDLGIMALLFLIINFAIFLCPNIIKVIFSNEVIMAFMSFFVPVLFLVLYIAFPIYYLVDKNTYKNILNNVFNIKLNSILDIIEGLITKSEIVLLLFLVLMTGTLSTLIGCSNPNVSNKYLVNFESYIDGDNTVEVVVYESDEYYCLETAEISPEKENLFNLIIYKDNYRWIRKDTIKTRLIYVFSSQIQDSRE